MAEFVDLSSEEAAEFIRNKRSGSIQVRGLIDLRNMKIQEVKANVRCHDLNATGSDLVSLPANIQVSSRLILDDCSKLESLPKNLTCGSISLRNCGYLSSLPENLSTWFLDMTNCERFSQWPKRAKIHRGSLVLRNCIELQELPPWLELVSQLDISGCVQLCEIPEGLRISSWLDLGGANVKSLPESLGNVALRWRSVPIDQRIAFRPETLKAKEAIKETNAEKRRVMIERMGYLKFAEEADAKVLDQDQDAGGDRRLLQIQLEDDEPLVGLFCSCPSTGRKYLLRVPPDTTTCHQAAAWMAGYDDPKLYKPVKET